MGGNLFPPIFVCSRIAAHRLPVLPPGDKP